MEAEQIITSRASIVQCAEGRMRMVKRGQPLPADALEGEAARLAALGVLAARDATAAPRGAEPSPAQALDDLMRSGAPKVSEVLEAVGDDRQLAAIALRIEREITGGEPRTTLVSQLQRVLDGDAGEG